MAKKVKTPEEVQASIDKKVARRKIFFGTFTKSLALFLAVAMVYMLTMIAYTKQPTAAAAGGQSAQQQEEEQKMNNEVDLDNDDIQGEVNKEITKAEAIKLVNDATAKAAKANGYKWSRNSDFNPGGELSVIVNLPLLGPQDATSTLNGIIKSIDPNGSVTTVVGSFLTIGDYTKADYTYTKGDTYIKDADGNGLWFSEKCLFKATALTEADCTKFLVKGDNYVFQLSSQKDPQKDGKNALHHATNDFVTEGEAAQAIKDAVGGTNLISLKEATVNYYEIVVTAVIDSDGNLQAYKVEYKFDAALSLSGDISGNGSAFAVMEYTDFAY